MVDLDELRREIVLAVSQSKSPREFLRDRRLRELYNQIKSLPPVERGPFGKQINELKQAIEQAIAVRLEELEKVDLKPIDVTAPMDMNSPKPELLLSEQGTIHPLSTEIERISEIFNRMGFVTEESREIDDQFHMFESLNFPKGHPARDDYDTFMTEETDSNGDRLIACVGIVWYKPMSLLKKHNI
jgi:phenylalanyl-tRNA synthetase alpha chain